MSIDFLLERFERNALEEAIVWRGRATRYGWLRDRVRQWRRELASNAIDRGTVAVLQGDFSPNAVALFLALMAGYYFGWIKDRL